LKQIVAGFNEECGVHMAKSGKKQELIDRIVDVVDQWLRTNNEDRWVKARAIIAQVRNIGQ
jgi:E3 SUMO-protein ligase PIAS1